MVMMMAMITAAARTAIIAPTVALVLTGGSTECMSKEKRLYHVKWWIIEGLYYTNQLGAYCKYVNMTVSIQTCMQYKGLAWNVAKPCKVR